MNDDDDELYPTPETIDNIVLQKTGRLEGDQNPDNTREEWKLITSDSDGLRAFTGLCIFAGIYRNNREPQSNLWSEDEGRPVFIATMARTRF